MPMKFGFKYRNPTSSKRILLALANILFATAQSTTTHVIVRCVGALVHNLMSNGVSPPLRYSLPSVCEMSEKVY